MQRRELGRTGMAVSELGVGCSRLGSFFATNGSRKEEAAMIHAAIDAGITFFDTADSYAQGQSEVVLGKALRGRRSSVVVATKGGYLPSTQRRLVARVKPLARPVVQALRIQRPSSGGGGGGANGPGGGNFASQDFSPAYLGRAVDASLRRLGTDYIDLYQLHSPSRSVIEAGEYVAVLEGLRTEGKIRHFGIGADGPADVAGFAMQPALASLQVPFSLLEPDARTVLFPATTEAGVGVVARSCYAAGLLDPRLAEEAVRAATPDWPEVLRLRAAAQHLDRSLLEAALQFSLGEPAVSVTIVGMRTRAHLEANLRHYTAAPLGADERAALLAPT